MGPKRRTGAGPSKLGELLLQKELVTQAQLSEALLQQSASGKHIGTLLVELGLIDERDLTHALAEQLHVEMIDLGRIPPDPEVLALLPESVARSLMAFPVRNTGGQLEIAVADPSDHEVADRLRQSAGQNIRLLIAPPTEIRRAIDNSYRALSGIESQIKAFEATAASRKVELSSAPATSEDAPVVKVVNAIVTQGLRDRASDIHIEPQDSRLRIRYRIDGALHDVLALPATMASAVVSRLKIMAGMNIVERMRPQDGQISMTIDGRALDIRVAHNKHDLGREGRAAAPGQVQAAVPPAGPRHGSRRQRGLLQAHPLALRHGSARARPAAARPPRSTPRSRRSTTPSATS